MINKKRIYVDMDDTLCNFFGAAAIAIIKTPGIQFPQSQYGFFTGLKPLPNAIMAMECLDKHYDVWIATRPSYENPLCYTEKRVWVEENLGKEWCKKLIIIPDKSLLKGDLLIDDTLWKGFEGEQILFGSDRYPNWDYVLKALLFN